MKKVSWIYLATYLSLGGTGFAFIPELALSLFMSNGDYGDIMPRVVGMFMIALGGLIATMTINNDLRYYPFAVFARTGMVVFLFWLFLVSKDPLFLVLNATILVGLLPSWYVYTTKSN